MLFRSLAPRFVRRYAELGREAREALAAFAADVRAGRFPTAAESYDDPAAAQPETEPARIYGA